MIVNNMPRIVGQFRARHGHLSGAVRERIEQLVLAGAIPAGARVNELRLAGELKVSRGVVREALRALERAGLLQAIPNRGVFVRKVTLEDALHLYDMRAGLAAVAAQLLARRATRAQIARLRATYAGMERASSARDVAAFYAANLRFHSQIIEFAGNPRLAAMSEAVRNELQLYLRDAVIGPARLKASQAEHKKLLDAIGRGDSERAGAAFAAHILAGKQRMLDYLCGHGPVVAAARAGSRGGRSDTQVK
jgi:DNA-binding GntR family transcriptional regulator